MDTLTNKTYVDYDYTCRYTDVPYYYDKLNNNYIYGIGTNMKKDTAFVSHTVSKTDTLEYLALKYYNNPTYWWMIAYFNDIQDSLIKLSDYFTVIKVPSMASIEFGDER